MAQPETSHYEAIIERQIRSGRASTKSEVIHQALELLDLATRGKGPPQSTFEGPDDLERLLLEGIHSGPATPMTEADWANLRKRA
jgi:putative addiction module CopG family antidote